MCDKVLDTSLNYLQKQLLTGLLHNSCSDNLSKISKKKTFCDGDLVYLAAKCRDGNFLYLFVPSLFVSLFISMWDFGQFFEAAIFDGTYWLLLLFLVNALLKISHEGPILYLLKTPENLWFFVFSGVIK